MKLEKVRAYLRIRYHWRLCRHVRLSYLPEDISIELTNSCNFKCSFCPQSDPAHFDHVSRSTLSPDRAEFLLNCIRKGGVTTDVLHLTLDGEPFVNKEIHEICGVAIARGFKKFIFSTNGYFATPDRLALMPRGDGVEYTLCIDFCADEGFFERFRGSRGSWNIVSRNISHILEAHDLARFRVKLIDITSYQAEDPVDLRASIDAMAALFPESDRLVMHTRVFQNWTGFLDGIKEQKQARSSSYNLCPYPWTSLVVASNGDVVACCRDLRHKTVLGNLFEDDLETIWNGSNYQKLRGALAEERPEEVSACRGCDLPYDASKFTLRHLVRTAVNRLGILR